MSAHDVLLVPSTGMDTLRHWLCRKLSPQAYTCLVQNLGGIPELINTPEKGILLPHDDVARGRERLSTWFHTLPEATCRPREPRSAACVRSLRICWRSIALL